MLEDFIKQLTKDVEIDLSQAFDRNFESKSFFNKKWPAEKYANSRGSMMVRSGKGRRSIKSKSNNGKISWNSSLPYMSIHNEGGEIKVTKKMISFFWAMYYKSNNAVLFNVKTKKAGNTQRNRKLTGEAAKWKAMALMKVGSTITIEQRQFIGWHPQVDVRIKAVVNTNLDEINKAIINKLKQQ